MMRSLLSERFQLRAHVETREQPIYALVTAASPARLGPTLRASTADCSASGNAPSGSCVMSGSFYPSGGVLKGVGQPLSTLATHLGTAVDRIVLDRAGLTGLFDFELSWSTDLLRADQRSNGDVPSVFTAVQEQLGLRLQPARGPVEVLVVDSVERPTPD